MQDYLYRGRSQAGDLIQGHLQGRNETEIARWLLSNAITPIDIRPTIAQPARDSAVLRWPGRRRTASEQDLILFTRQMRAIMRAGIPLTQALNSLQTGARNAGFAAVLAQLQAKLEQGNMLSQAMQRHPDDFSEYYINMIKVGESTGLLEESFARLLEQLQFDFAMKQKIRAALRYPVFVLMAIVAAFAIVTTFVMPTFATMFSDMKIELPLLTRMLLSLSELTTRSWWVVMLIGGASVLVLRMVLTLPSVRPEWDRIKLGLPIIGGIIRKASLARFSRSLSTALRSGVPVVEAFTIVSRVVDNSHYERCILAMRSGVERGDSMLHVASSAAIFPPIMLQMIAVGEQTGDLDGLLAQIADIQREEVEYEADRLGAAIEPLLLLALGLLVGILMLGIFEPMWKMTQLARPG